MSEHPTSPTAFSALFEKKQKQGEPVAWQLWVGADTPFDEPMGWSFYNTYDSLRSAEASARTINSAKQAPFAKIVPLYTKPQRTWVGLSEEEVDAIYAETEEKVGKHWDEGGTTMMFPKTLYEAFEAKLKEKNHE